MGSSSLAAPRRGGHPAGPDHPATAVNTGPSSPITPRMTWIDGLMPDVANAGRRTRAAVVRAAVAMLATLAVQVGCTFAGAAGGALYGIVVAAGFVSIMTVLVL